MRTKIYIDPETFEATQLNFEEFHYELAEKVSKAIGEVFVKTTVTDILSNKEGDKLIIGVFKERNPGEKSEKYKITIEKVVE